MVMKPQINVKFTDYCQRCSSRLLATDKGWECVNCGLVHPFDYGKR